MPMTKYENTKISKQTLVLEECVFVNCVISDCDIFYDGGDFLWQKTRFEGDCRWYFRDAAARSQNLFRILGLLKAEQKPQPPTETSTGGLVN